MNESDTPMSPAIHAGTRDASAQNCRSDVVQTLCAVISHPHTAMRCPAPPRHPLLVVSVGSAHRGYAAFFAQEQGGTDGVLL